MPPAVEVHGKGEVPCPSGLAHAYAVEGYNEQTRENEVYYKCPCGYEGPGFRSEVTARMAWDRICPKQYVVPSVEAATPPAAAAAVPSEHAEAVAVLASAIGAALTASVPYVSLQVQIIGEGAFAVTVQHLPDPAAGRLPFPWFEHE
jgi:hypothetical protein